MTNDVNYIKERLLLSEQAEQQLQSEELEMTLVQRYMNLNGWDFPSPDEDATDYDIAVHDVKWFIRQLLELAR